MTIRRLTLTTALFLFATVPLLAEETIEVKPKAPPVPHAAPASEVVAAPARGRPVDLAICLDTSGSMNGLIDAARQKLWAIVNDLALAQPSPELRVSLVTFGNDGHDAAQGWVQVQTSLTSDLDLVSDKLFKLTTNGGTELVGRAIHTAMRDLEWSKDEQALKIVIVAGNESADQDREVTYAMACKGAIERGVMVDAIFCGAAAAPDAEGWRQVARLADGHFANIDQQNGTIVVATPFDEALAKLSASINGTYLPYGAQGAWSCENQQRQDANAAGASSGAAAGRAASKASFSQHQHQHRRGADLDRSFHHG
jgi:Mg-chelatase subunit ChlD